MSFFYEGIDNDGNKRKIPFSLSRKEGASQFQVLTDWLCQQNPHFRKEYDALMQKRLTEGGWPLKYTGKKPLHITSVHYLHYSMKEKTIYQKGKGSCPFLEIYKAKKENE